MWPYIFALVLICSAYAEINVEKRSEMSPVPFVLSTRYGRSPPRVMMPRNDRFFFGSRYGKRSEVSMGTSLPPPGAPTLMCEYTGVYSLYRCKLPNRNTYTDRTSEESPGSQE
ncbi:RYamide neuropeptides [Plodia interpunctella]|uniref:RYamide neuropeptides n=1 Tax=Plodia interpunctella TaxID=58824 RepID=UPI00236749F1|nr:RYamide neuropeptides-like [Plodia interpunctella]XP_053621673.1 RYamide neuropeptides-like [Plodia interpunctella]XP_053621674.1 RYamide neuropeptides-like [Plodia interpunctella]